MKHMGQIQQGIEMSQKSIEISEETKVDLVKIKNLLNIAEMYLQENEHNISIEYLYKCLKCNCSNYELSKVYLNFSKIYKKINRKEQAEFLFKSHQYAIQSQDATLVAICSRELGIYFYEHESFDKSAFYLISAE